ncbi:lysophospholipid acyltransferase family protein [Brachybacterium hainanense]|uniref:Lysophospholipid acyltransferase family protein n=1 Tax=Brachybacterium hainanense TaxID=1541174 RepID=A0ABV6RG78_9MICO
MLYEIAKPPVALVVRILWAPQIRGAERIPRSGPAILASNHLSAADTVFLPAQLDRTVHFLGKADFFRGRSLPGRAVAWVMRQLGIIPVDRTGGSASDGALEAGLGVLRRGEVLGIYPEGTRSPDGRLFRAKTGVARLALGTGAPIIPVAMLGAFEAGGGRLLPRRRPRIIAVIGEPVDAEAIRAAHPELSAAELLRRIADTVVHEIGRLSGQEYVDRYAAEVKAELRARADAAHRRDG